MPDSDVKRALTRRQAVRVGLGGFATLLGAGALGVELVDHNVLPGRTLLDEIDGACDVAMPAGITYGRSGRAISGSFYSSSRGRTVGYTLSYPPGHGPGSRLPLIVALHGYGGNHADVLSGGGAHALAVRVHGAPLAPMAIASVDGGNGYWHRHGSDDPMAMLTDEFIPFCQRRGLGRLPLGIGAIGISMGGYGALLLAEKHPALLTCVAAISPAVWTSYEQAHSANAGAYTSPSDFAENDVVTHAARLRGVAVRVAAGDKDPFYPGVQTLVKALPPGATAELSGGCHSAPFFDSQEPPSLAFLAAHLGNS